MSFDFAIYPAIKYEALCDRNRLGCADDGNRRIQGMTSQIHEHATTAGSGVVVEPGTRARLGCERALGNGHVPQGSKPVLADQQPCQNHRTIAPPLEATG